MEIKMKEEGDIKKCPWGTSTHRLSLSYKDKETIVPIVLRKALLTENDNAGPR